MDEFGVDKDVIRTSSTRSIRWRHQNLALATNLWNWVRVKDSQTLFLVGLRILISVDSLKFNLAAKFHCQKVKSVDFASKFVPKSLFRYQFGFGSEFVELG